MRKKLVVLLLVGLVSLAVVPRVSSVSRFYYNDKEIEAIVTRDLEGQPGEYAVYIKRLDNDTMYALNKDFKFPTASLYKLVVMATAFQFEKDGKLSLDTPILGTNKYTVEEAMNRITAFSDNDSALMLTDMLRAGQTTDPLQEQAKALGMDSTDFSKELPETTAADIGLFFEKLYKGEVVSKAASDRLLEKLSKAELNDRIPAHLPAGTRVAHKTGELPYLRHDAGIVYLEGKPYVIVLMSQDLKMEDDGIELLAKISQDVYNYFVQ